MQEYESLRILCDRLIDYDQKISDNYVEMSQLRISIDCLLLEKEKLEMVIQHLQYRVRVQVQHIDHIESEINDVINVSYFKMFNFEKKLVKKLWRL